MPDIKFTCPGCQQPLEAPEDMAGEVCECPNCENQMTIPSPGPVAGQEPNKLPTSAAMASALEEAATQGDGASDACSECGATMEKDAVLCMSCGFHKGLGKKISTDLG